MEVEINRKEETVCTHSGGWEIYRLKYFETNENKQRLRHPPMRNDYLA